MKIETLTVRTPEGRRALERFFGWPEGWLDDPRSRDVSALADKSKWPAGLRALMRKNDGEDD